MKRGIALLVSLLAGVGIGWFLGFSCPAAKNQRELLAQYHRVRDNFRLTDTEMAEIGPKLPQLLQNMEQQDTFAAAMALGVFQLLEQGETDRAKTHLLKVVGNYYHSHHDNGGDSNVIGKIIDAANKYPAVAAETTNKIE